jgi:hypothetical protein
MSIHSRGRKHGNTRLARALSVAAAMAIVASLASCDPLGLTSDDSGNGEQTADVTRYTLHLYQRGEGTVTFSPAQPAEGYLEGTAVNISATADDGWVAGIVPPASVTISRNALVVAFFAGSTSDPDFDDDTIPDSDEAIDADDNLDNDDTDSDGTPNYQDNDDDDDGVPTLWEAGSSGTVDTDSNGTPDYLDVDDDGDGIATPDELPVTADADNDGIPDFLDPD